VFFRDMQYLWNIFTQLLMWTSAIFYSIENFSYTVQCVFLINPIYLYIRYFRKIVIDSTVPTVGFHILAAAYAVIAFAIGFWMYKKYNHEFLYYV
jgi:ABC-2 type transport system permease protein